MFATQRPEPSRLRPCGQPEHKECGLRLILDRLGEKWTVMTLAELTAGPRRYRELERALFGVTQRMLTLTLRRLERDGFVTRSVEPTNPPSVTYALTGRGLSFSVVVADLVDWAREHQKPITVSQQDFDRMRGSEPR